MTAKGIITAAQRNWAESAGIALDPNGYVPSFEDNLYLPPDDQLLADFGAGSGGELTEGRRRPAKFRAPHSSSVLAVNVFDYFRRTDQTDQLAGILGLLDPVRSLRFERRYRTGISQPNLDVELKGDTVVAIESKFREPYEKASGAGKKPGPSRKIQKASSDDPFAARYFSTTGLWGRLARCRELAVEIQERHCARDPLFRRLDAAQLLKHALGMVRTLGDTNVRLMYLWFEVWDGPAKHPATLEHEDEISSFTERIQGEIDFSSLSYHQFFRRLREEVSLSPAYVEYLGSRYFERERRGMPGDNAVEEARR